ncbi:hypothetical protein QW71_12930 [Paenibacillus sp. IHB B 3415]|uniref:helix-turn-helix domain-containing protein n=1 Tax=Paenibacillus sp. IHB B 3415 TaxID=867080 RepID=UPI0005732DA8|nr:helix-turn-helix domain-containing protein [Paenibacillus sp. IHB B 3415]KHL95364.1 hypothetical protein QW71_12930 [Paenibacillus sp. IHB B 3415]
MHETQQAPVHRRTLTVSEVAEMIGVSSTSIYQSCREGAMPHLRVRSRILFHREVIEEWMKNGGMA